MATTAPGDIPSDRFCHALFPVACAGLIIAARRYRQGARSILTHGSSSSSSATWSDSLTPPQTSSARSSALTGLFKGSSSTAVLDDSVAPLATDISAEEITFCLDGEGQPVMLGQGSWGCIYLACRWGTQVPSTFPSVRFRLSKTSFPACMLLLLDKSIRGKKVCQRTSIDCY